MVASCRLIYLVSRRVLYGALAVRRAHVSVHFDLVGGCAVHTTRGGAVAVVVGRLQLSHLRSHLLQHTNTRQRIVRTAGKRQNVAY